MCHFATTEMLVITTPTHKQQDDVSWSKMCMDVIPKVYSLETFWTSQLLEGLCFGNGAHIFFQNLKCTFSSIFQEWKNDLVSAKKFVKYEGL